MDREALAQMIWNKPLQEVTETDAASVVQQYPFFSAARFLYLNKLKENTEAYAGQFQKAMLFYHNPTLFSLFLKPPENIIFQQKQPAFKEVETPHDTDAEEQNKQPFKQLIQKEPLIEQSNNNNTAIEEPLLFEPFHTVDYFASQGIKPSADEMPKDKFGQQLKSFTDWLKTMKKLPATEIAKDVGPDKNVEHLAAHSLDEANVITESMAEVWLKQGNKEKAVQTYTKLSLQNPDKSAYFAAKIENINSQKQ